MPLSKDMSLQEVVDMHAVMATVLKKMQQGQAASSSDLTRLWEDYQRLMIAASINPGKFDSMDIHQYRTVLRMFTANSAKIIDVEKANKHIEKLATYSMLYFLIHGVGLTELAITTSDIDRIVISFDYNPVELLKMARDLDDPQPQVSTTELMFLVSEVIHAKGDFESADNILGFDQGTCEFMFQNGELAMEESVINAWLEDHGLPVGIVDFFKEEEEEAA